jgi:hypothetical protein
MPVSNFGRVFSGNMPLRPDVEKIKRSFPARPGLLITHEQFEEVLGLNATLTDTEAFWRLEKKWVKAEHLYRIESERNVGYLILNTDQALETSYKDVESINRKTRKAAP